MERVESLDEGYVAELAAGHDESPTMLQRLPLSCRPRERFQTAALIIGKETKSSERTETFVRPEGSLEARAFGNVVHAFLELMARRISQGTVPERLAEEIKSWDGRIAAVLRGEALAPATVARLQRQVIAALENTLHDADGLWILSAQDDAASEYGLTVWEERPGSVRLDRVFRAGDEPRAAERRCLWIVDYKTTAHAPHGVERFLEEERKKYAPQMEAYARVMQATSKTELRLGLYYPLLPKLIWWKPES